MNTHWVKNGKNLKVLPFDYGNQLGKNYYLVDQFGRISMW